MCSKVQRKTRKKCSSEDASALLVFTLYQLLLRLKFSYVQEFEIHSNFGLLQNPYWSCRVKQLPTCFVFLEAPIGFAWLSTSSAHTYFVGLSKSLLVSSYWFCMDKQHLNGFEGFCNSLFFSRYMDFFFLL